jgi:hypothetical protein
MKFGSGGNGLPEPELVVIRAVHQDKRVIYPTGERVSGSIGDGVSPGFKVDQPCGFERRPVDLKNAFKALDGLPGEQPAAEFRARKGAAVE